MSMINKDQMNRRWLLDEHERHWQEDRIRRSINRRLVMALSIVVIALLWSNIK